MAYHTVLSNRNGEASHAIKKRKPKNVGTETFFHTTKVDGRKGKQNFLVPSMVEH